MVGPLRRISLFAWVLAFKYHSIVACLILLALALMCKVERYSKYHRDYLKPSKTNFLHSILVLAFGYYSILPYYWPASWASIFDCY